jgi:LacI family transcriptional regulator
MVVPELANPFFIPIIDAVQAVAQQKHYMVIINQSAHQPDMELAIIHQLRRLRMTGVLITPASSELDHLRSIQAEGTPTVVVARCWEEGDCVTVDDYAGGCMVAEHLLQLGHGKIGCVTHDEVSNTAVQARLRGFRETLYKRGVELSPQHIIRVETVRMTDAVRAAEAFMALADMPTAVFTTADRLAIGFIHELINRGIQVPEDVAVVGYDDIRYAQFLEVPLTTVSLPKYELGRQAVQLLFERTESSDHRGEPHQIMLKPQLVVRVSCGAHLSKDRQLQAEWLSL